MRFAQNIRDNYHDRKASKLISQGAFQGAVDHIKKISSFEKQRHVTFGNLAAYAISILVKERGSYIVEYAETRQEYERLRALLGQFTSEKIILYRNPETGDIEGLEDIIERVISPDNLVIKYLKYLSEMDSPT